MAPSSDMKRMMLLTFTSMYWIIFSFIFLILLFMMKIPNLPPVLWDLMTFGKANTVGTRRVRISLEKMLSSVPKRFFLHFYVFSIVSNGFILLLLINQLFLGGTVPQWYITTLETLTYYPLEKPTASHLSVLIAIAAVTIQGMRRLYECFFISSYSNATMHVAHYILGCLFYPLTGITILTEGPNLLEQVPFHGLSDLVHNQLTWYHIAGSAMYIWASWHHNRAHVIFASLRHGDMDANTHKIPYGDWFEIVSCPHYLAEILIYLSILVILGGSHLLAYGMMAFVLTNQIGCGITSHQWYLKKFENYPKHRNAIIPFVL